MKYNKIFFLIIFVSGMLVMPFFVLAAEKDCPPKDGTIVLQVNIPGITVENCTSGNAKFYSIKEDYNGDGKRDMLDFFALMYRFLVGIAGIAAVIAMMAGGYIWLFAGGNASKIGEAKSIISSAFLGLFLALGSYMVMNLINPDLVKWRFSPSRIETPSIAGGSGVTHICSSEEKKQALSQLNPKDQTLFKCGSVYYPNYKNFEEKCAKGKEKELGCIEAKKKAFDDGCMEVVCEPGTGAYACVISADKDGNLTSGQCLASVSVKAPAGYINYTVKSGAWHVIGEVCGIIDGSNLRNPCPNSDDNTCTAIKTTNLIWDPSKSLRYVYGDYRGGKVKMACRGDMWSQLMTINYGNRPCTGGSC